MGHKPTKFPFIMAGTQDDIALSPAVGGTVLPFTAAATLLIGDVVYLSAANTVNKSATAATVGAAFMGVVVGGDTFDRMGQVQSDDINQTTLVGQTAATVGQRVLVQIAGVANVVAGASAPSAGNQVIGGATAGTVIAGTTAGSMLGTAITTASGAGAAFKMLIDHR